MQLTSRRRRRLFADRAARARYAPRLVPGIDRELWRLAGAEVVIDRALGRALGRLKEGLRYRRLGFELWRDYVRERVGVEPRWAQYLMVLDRGCQALPEVWEALTEGVLTTWKALLLFQVVGKETPAEERRAWLERGKKFTVRELEREVQVWKESRGAAPTSARAMLSEDPRERKPGQWLEFRVPERTAEVWRVAREVARRVSQEPLPAYRCLETMVAERFSALGGEEWFERMQQVGREEEARVRAVVEKHARARAWLGLDEAEGEETAGLGEAGWSGVERLEEACARAAGGWAFLAWQRRGWEVSSELDPLEAFDGWELDRVVQGLEALRKQLRRLQGELLGAIEELEGWRLLGFASFRHYFRERLGLRESEVRRLIWFAAALSAYPELGEKVEAGELSYIQVVMLLAVVQPETARAWAVWASGTTCQATARAVEDAERYGLPGATPAQVALWRRELRALGKERAREARALAGKPAVAPTSAREEPPPPPPVVLSWSTSAPGSAPAVLDPRALPPGVALPPTAPGGRSHIVGLDLAATGAPEPDRPIARIRFHCPDDSAAFIRAGLRSCQDPARPWLADWQCLEILMVGFLKEHLENPEARRLIAAYPTLERDGWQCQVPICSGRGALNRHHVWWRGRNGPDADWNTTAACVPHHLEHIHGMQTIAVSGKAPGDLTWEIGLRPGGGPPLLRFHGETRLDIDEPWGHAPPEAAGGCASDAVSTMN